MPVCDVCDQPMEWGQGYGLTTAQIVTKEAYWEYMFTHQWSMVHEKDSQGDSVAYLAQNQANQSTSWLVCESCSTLFSF